MSNLELVEEVRMSSRSILNSTRTTRSQLMKIPDASLLRFLAGIGFVFHDGEIVAQGASGAIHTSMNSNELHAS